MLGLLPLFDLNNIFSTILLPARISVSGLQAVLRLPPLPSNLFEPNHRSISL